MTRPLRMKLKDFCL